MIRPPSPLQPRDSLQQGLSVLEIIRATWYPGCSPQPSFGIRRWSSAECRDRKLAFCGADTRWSDGAELTVATRAPGIETTHLASVAGLVFKNASK